MLNNNPHLSERELILSADGELPGRRQAQVRAHLETCWSCRERMASLEATIADFVRARNHELDSRILPEAGPRALLRAQVAQAGAEANASSAARGAWRLAPAAAACFLLAIVLIVFETSVSAEGPVPRFGITPGETRPITLAEVCRTSQAIVVSDGISPETQRQVFSAYGIKSPGLNQYEVDYLITPDLGGTESVRNLWPQPYSARWNARVKDRLEQRLHQLVCEGRVDLSTAQREIAGDWIGAYKKYVGSN